MYFVYLLKSEKDERTYVGYTTNVAKRLSEHNAGKVRATKNRRPFTILMVEKFQKSSEAKKKEIYWKSGGGRRKLKNLFISNGFPPIQKF